MTDGYRSSAFRQRICQHADNVEYAAIRRKSAVLQTGLLEAEISGALDDFEHERDGAVGAAWQQRDLELDDGVTLVQAELARRERLLGTSYPFRLSDAVLTYNGRSENLLYEFCLAISCAPNVTTGPYVQLARIFERVVSLVAEVFLGDGAQSLHVGTPRDPSVGTLFPEAMKTLHDLTSEFRWDPEAPYLADDPPTNGDEGVDFIAWKSPGDSRPGRLFILGQCACGSTIDEKYDDANYDKFRKWFRPAATVAPMRALATPRHIPDLNLQEAQREAGIVFDRARLTLISGTHIGRAKVAVHAERMTELIDLVVMAA